MSTRELVRLGLFSFIFAMEAIGRQPDAYGKIQTAMLIAAALVEGFGFAALFAV